jgi:hypothetical protein
MHKSCVTPTAVRNAVLLPVGKECVFLNLGMAVLVAGVQPVQLQQLTVNNSILIRDDQPHWCAVSIPVAPFSAKMLVAPGAPKMFTMDFNLLSKVQDEDANNLNLVVWNVTKAWGSGVLLRNSNSKLTGVWRFTANAAGIKANSVLWVRYNVTDAYGATGTGVFFIRFSGESSGLFMVQESLQDGFE